MTMFLATELLLYSKMSTERYRTIFAAFLFLSGTALIFKSVFCVSFTVTLRVSPVGNTACVDEE